MPLAKGDTAPTVIVRGISADVSLPYPDSSTVIFFYPTNQGSTCVNEIVDFDTRLAEFTSLGIKAVGVTTEVLSGAASLKERRHLTIPLYSDIRGEASALYGVKNAYGFSDRYTFLISKDRKVLSVWQAFDTSGHAEEVLKYCRREISR
jgi:peroxiredoxin Q/BCP